jgi:hypothetical protein
MRVFSHSVLWPAYCDLLIVAIFDAVLIFGCCCPLASGRSIGFASDGRVSLFAERRGVLEPGARVHSRNCLQGGAPLQVCAPTLYFALSQYFLYALFIFQIVTAAGIKLI